MANLSGMTIPVKESGQIVEKTYEFPSGGGSSSGLKTFYGSCDTAAATADKVVICPDFAESDLKAGTTIYIKFTNNNTASSITLTINGKTAKSVARYGSTTGSMSGFSWISGQVVPFVYDGTYWQMIWQRVASTSVSGIVQLSSATNSTSTTVAATASAVKAAYDLANGKMSKVSGATANNFAGLDANGNVIDSGKKASDFLTQHQDISGKMNTNGSNADSHVIFNGALTVGSRASGTVGTNSVAEGNNTIASGIYSHAEGYGTTASNYCTHAEGLNTQATNNGAHAEGRDTIASGDYSHAEGAHTTAGGLYAATGAHAEGYGKDSTHRIKASAPGAHAEGYAKSGNTLASGYGSHAEGWCTTASGDGAHAGGNNATATRKWSFAHGNGDSSYLKFRGSAMGEKGKHCFGFDMSGEEWTANTEITDSHNGCEGTILESATVTLDLDVQGQYLLFCSAYTISSGAIYGATTRMIIAHGLSTGTPTNVSLGQTSNAPATITMAANNKVTIKNAATSRATQFSLIRIN